MNKRFLSGLAALAVVFSGAGALPAGTIEGFSLTASAADIVDSGYCGRMNENEGKNVTWSFDNKGTLTTSGTVDMTDFANNDVFVNQSQLFTNETADGFTYYIDFNKTNAIITGYNGKIADIKIPSTIEGVKVTDIDNFAFKGNQTIKSITFPDSVTSIGISAFEDAANLNTVIFGRRMDSIKSSAFERCVSLKTIKFNNNLTNIGSYSFHQCTSLQEIYFPSSLNRIDDGAFSECSKLTFINFNNNLSSIGKYAFSDCMSMNEVILPDTVTILDIGAFRNCTSLSKITIPNSVVIINRFAFFNDKTVTIYCYKDSYAHKYAIENKISYSLLPDKPFVPSDLDGNGTVDVDDLVLMQKKVAGWKVDEKNKEAADLNGDGNVDVDDLVLMQKIVAGWKVELDTNK